jgi:hypothetical protein
MTKSEQTVFDRIRAANDAGRTANERSAVAQVGAQKANRMGRGYRPGHPNKLEQTALQHLLERGACSSVARS